MVAKLNLVIVAAAAGGLLWIEHTHRIRIETPAPPEVAGRDTAICPENESVPFSADCMKFIRSVVEVDLRARAAAANGTLADSPELP